MGSTHSLAEEVKRRVFVVDDDANVRSIVSGLLEDAGFAVSDFGNGVEGLDATLAAPPDVLLLDVRMPQMDGLEVCRRLRADVRTETLPIVLLTVCSSEADIEEGFNAGADQYITKPWAPRTLVPQIRAALRRAHAPAFGRVLVHGPLTIDPARREALLEGIRLPLKPGEFRILWLLAAHPDRVFSRSELLGHRDGEHGGEENVPAYVSMLRRKLGRHGDLIETVHGVGYRIASLRVSR